MDQESAEPPWPEFPDFVASRARYLLRTAFLLAGGDAHLAEDLVQEALGRIYLKWRKVSRLDNPSGYAQTVLVNTYLSYRRKRSASERVTDEFPEVGVHDPDPALRLTLLRALAELPAPDRAVLVLRFWEDRSVEETAAALRSRPPPSGVPDSRARSGSDTAARHGSRQPRPPGRRARSSGSPPCTRSSRST
ncbi:sigma factor [Kitasatospora sp. NPDC017646]|uniref:sigma factor n=1 Tax=Kitasatospora sp. NPDC017646 TaxID=3364024 RepID=UPI00378FE254